MAERQPEEEEKQFPCEFCPNAYKSAKALLNHMREKHANEPLLQEAIKSAPKDTCPFCGEAFGNVVKHKPRCAKNPEKPPPQVPPARVQPLPQVPPPRVPQQQYEGMSDDDLVQEFRNRMRKRKLLKESSIKEYERHLKAFIQHEKRLDPRFMAWRWFASGTKEQRDSRFIVLRRFDDYVEAVRTDQGRATVKQMMSAYSHLNTWILEKVQEQMQGDDPLAQLGKNKAGLKDSRILLNRGTFQPGQGRKTRDPVMERLDVNITQQVLQLFVDSPLRRETLDRFSQGNFTSPCLGVGTMQGAQDFLALLLYLENFGTRFDVVQNLTLGQLNR